MTHEIKIMSRPEAIKYCHKPQDERAVMISISTPFETYHSAPFSSPKNKVMRVLRLFFEDEVDGPNVMTERDAAAVADFIRRYADAPRIIVHCDAGRSRSAAVAAAVEEHFGGDPRTIFESYEPNAHCFAQTRRAFENAKE